MTSQLCKYRTVLSKIGTIVFLLKRDDALFKQEGAKFWQG